MGIARVRFFTFCLLIAAFALVTFNGCNSSSKPAGSVNGAGGGNAGKLNIVTTCSMVTDIVREVAGDKAVVGGLMGPEVDPHIFRPTSSDVKKLSRADIVFYSGLLLEGQMGEAFSSVRSDERPVVAVAEAIDKSKLRSPPEFAGHHDPHVWMDVSLWSVAVGVVADELAKFDPDNADYYRANAAAYQTRLTALDNYARDSLATIPAGQRVLITAHDAFGYFAKAYGLKIRSPQGLTTESEASLKDITDLVDFIVAGRIGAVFVETTVNEANMNALIKGAADKGHTVVIGGKLFSDATGRAGTYEATYIGMIDHNVTTVTRALGGEAPEKGLNGKLTGSTPH